MVIKFLKRVKVCAGLSEKAKKLIKNLPQSVILLRNYMIPNTYPVLLILKVSYMTIVILPTIAYLNCKIINDPVSLEIRYYFLVT